MGTPPDLPPLCLPFAPQVDGAGAPGTPGGCFPGHARQSSCDGVAASPWGALPGGGAPASGRGFGAHWLASLLSQTPEWDPAAVAAMRPGAPFAPARPSARAPPPRGSPAMPFGQL